MDRTLRLFLLLPLFVACGGNELAVIGSDPESVQNRIAAAGGNFLDPSIVRDLLEDVGDRDEFESLTDPVTVDPGHRNASYMLPTDLVLGIVINGEARAYPHNIGWWHEIINDNVGGKNIVVSFCPLTGTGMVFDGDGRDGTRISLGVSGLLFNNNLVMFDRRDGDRGNTLYPQMTSQGVSGPREGEELELMPVVETTFEFWRELYPDTKILSGLTPQFQPGTYTLYPYGPGGGRSSDYREDEVVFFSTVPSFEENPIADLFHRKDLALGIRFGEIAKAYPYDNMGERAVINDEVGGNPLVVVYHGEASFAVPYSRIHEGQTLTFDMVESPTATMPFFLRDRETGTLWNLKGEGVDGRFVGTRLRQIPAHVTYWFAWATFWQNTGIF